MPITNLQKRFPRLGRISCGYQALSKKGNPYPVRSETLVVSSPRGHSVLRWAAEALGGTIQQSPIDEDKWFVQTEARELRVLFPSDEPDLICSQWMTAYASSGLVRRCDGETTVMWRKPAPKGSKDLVGDLSDEQRPCICRAEGLVGTDQACKPVVRISVLPFDYWMDIPDHGVWELTSGGWSSNTELANDIELMTRMVGGIPAGVPLTVRVDQVPSRHGPVPKLSLRMAVTPRQALQLAEATRVEGLAGHLAPVAALDAGDETPIGTFVAEPDDQDEASVADPDNSAGPADTTAPPEPTASPAEAPAGAAQTTGEPVTPCVVAGVACTLAPGAPHTPATTEAEMVSAAQTKQLVALCDQLGITTDEFQESFEARYGFPFVRTAQCGGATKLQAQSHADWLKAQLTAKAAS